MEIKHCCKCATNKDVTEFRKKGIDYYSYCKECDRKYQREYRLKNLDKVHEYEVTRRKKYPFRYRKHALRQYGLTLEQYELRLIEQYNRCKICKTDTPGGNGIFFYVDHDHQTGKVRGLLCHRCNAGLASFKDNIEIMQAAIQYIYNSQQ